MLKEKNPKITHYMAEKQSNDGGGDPNNQADLSEHVPLRINWWKDKRAEDIAKRMTRDQLLDLKAEVSMFGYFIKACIELQTEAEGRPEFPFLKDSDLV